MVLIDQHARSYNCGDFNLEVIHTSHVCLAILVYTERKISFKYASRKKDYERSHAVVSPCKHQASDWQQQETHSYSFENFLLKSEVSLRAKLQF